MDPKTAIYLRKLFQGYYRHQDSSFFQIPSLKFREIAFFLWNQNYMIRHRSFPEATLLFQRITRNPPRHLYYSGAYYNDPGNEQMDNKQHHGCDLIFDLDADHLTLPCQKKHDYLYCQKCLTINSKNVKKCNECGGPIKEITWICPKCLRKIKTETEKLLTYLQQDFGILAKEINVSYSGHRGYHVILRTNTFLTLDSEARREIVDYLSGIGHSPQSFGLVQEKTILKGFTSQTLWNKRIIKEFISILKTNQIKSQFNEILTEIEIKEISTKRVLIAEAMEQTRDFWYIGKIPLLQWLRMIKKIRQSIGVHLDGVVSIDLHRLIRIPYSLHGKSGMQAIPIPIKDFSLFNPLHDALAFPITSKNKLTIKIIVPYIPWFYLGHLWFGGYTLDQIITLPLNAALFLLCKEVAVLQ